MPDSLPVESVLPQIAEAVRDCGAVVLTSPPGSGKTTLVPPHLLELEPSRSGEVVLVQPRRLAARAAAARLAEQRGVPLGGEVGYQVRLDRRTSKATRLRVVTPGILLRDLDADPFLERTDAVVLDEFHERSVEMDLLLGMLVRLRQTVRPELRVIVMSATLEASAVSAHLEDCVAIDAPGRQFPVDIRYAGGLPRDPLEPRVTAAVDEALRETDGHVLVFLPGVREIRRCHAALEEMAERAAVALWDLYGDLPPERQDAVLRESGERKIILATNVAETSLTIEGVTAVVDSGLVRQQQIDPHVGLPRLELVPVSQASADQRAGRAGRTAPGVCWRLWSAAMQRARPEATLPEVLRTDLSGAVLHLSGWGEHAPRQFPWLTPPKEEALHAAAALLERLGAVDEANRPTQLGQQMLRIPAHPRLGRLLIEAEREGILPQAALAAALLTERDPFRGGASARSGSVAPRSASDLVDRVAALSSDASGGPAAAGGGLELNRSAARRVRRVADQLCRATASAAGGRSAEHSESETSWEERLQRCLLAAFPDRLARLRSGSTERGRMVGGRGVRLAPQSAVRGEEFFLCIDLDDRGGDALVRMASRVDRKWLKGPLLQTRDELFFDPSAQQVMARRRTYWDDLLLEETPTAISDPAAAAELLAEEAARQWERAFPADDPAVTQWVARTELLREAMPELELPQLDQQALRGLLPEVCRGCLKLEEVRRGPWVPAIQQYVGYTHLATIERQAPERIRVASGNAIAVRYEVGKPPVLAVRIQELYGQGETPRIAGGRVPLLLHLLGPNHRVQQVTEDLASFWANTYPTVRKELKRRYPKHHWPEDPAGATATRSGLGRHAT